MEPDAQIPPVSQPTQNNQPTPKSSNRKWIIIILLLVVLMILFTSGAFLFGKSQSSNNNVSQSLAPTNTPASVNNSITPTTEPEITADQSLTAGWKTYESNCGISVKYPSTWFADNKFFASDKDVCINIGDENFKTGSGDAISGFYLNIHKREFNKSQFDSLEEYIKDYEIEGIPFNYKPKNYGAFSGYEFDPPGRGDNRSFMFVKDNYIYEVNWIISTSNPYTNIIPQIISSIKFTY